MMQDYVFRESRRSPVSCVTGRPGVGYEIVTISDTLVIRPMIGIRETLIEVMPKKRHHYICNRGLCYRMSREKTKFRPRRYLSLRNLVATRHENYLYHSG